VCYSTVRLYEVIDTNDQLFMIMEYASGGISFIVFLVFDYCHSLIVIFTLL